jgi:hypothetical protein
MDGIIHVSKPCMCGWIIDVVDKKKYKVVFCPLHPLTDGEINAQQPDERRTSEVVQTKSVAGV